MSIMHDDVNIIGKRENPDVDLSKEIEHRESTLRRIAADCAQSISSIKGRSDAVEIIVRVWEAAAHAIMRDIELHPGVNTEIGVFEGYFVADAFEYLKIADIVFSKNFLECHGLDCRSEEKTGLLGWADCGFAEGPPIPLSPLAVARYAKLDRGLVGSILPALIHQIGVAMTEEQSLVVSFGPLGKFRSSERLVEFIPAERYSPPPMLSRPIASTVETIVLAQQRRTPKNFKLASHLPNYSSIGSAPATPRGNSGLSKNMSVSAGSTASTPRREREPIGITFGSLLGARNNVCAESQCQHLTACYNNKAPRFHCSTKDPNVGLHINDHALSLHQEDKLGTSNLALSFKSRSHPQQEKESPEILNTWTMTLEKKFGHLENNDTVGRLPRNSEIIGPSPWRKILGLDTSPNPLSVSGSKYPRYQDIGDF